MEISSMDWVLLICVGCLIVIVVAQGQAIKQLQIISDLQDLFNKAVSLDIDNLEKGKNYVPPPERPRPSGESSLDRFRK